MTSIAAKADDKTPTILLGVILAVGAGFRFWGLDGPSMWWDEILVPLIVRFPWLSILEWLRTIEVHPPLYYAIIKLTASLDASDFALRLPSALCGLASIYLLYALGKDLLDAPTGLAAAALLAVNPYAVWLSRIVRPYALFLALFLVSLLALRRWLASGGRSWFWCLMGSILAMYWTHYMMVILAPAYGLAVLASRWPRLGDFWRFCLGVALCFASILPFFMQNFGREHWLGAGSPMDILLGMGTIVGKLAWFFQGPEATVLLVLAGLGLAWAAARRPGPFWMAVALATIPVGAVMAGRLAWYHEPRYFISLMPVLLLAAAKGLSLLPLIGQGRRLGWLSLVLAAGLGAAVAARAPALYGERALLGIEWISYKTVARAIPGLVKPGEPWLVSEDGLGNALDWYVERQGGPNPLRRVSIEEGQREVILNFLWFERMGHLAQTPKELAERFPGLVHVGDVDKLSFFKTVLQRNPVQQARTLPWERTFAGTVDFVAASASLSGLTPTPFWGGELRLVDNEIPGAVEFAVENRSGEPTGPARVSVRYANTGQGGELRLSARFDDGPWLEGALSQGPDRHHYRRVFFPAPRSFTRLTVRVDMACPRLTALYPGGNLNALTLREVTVALDRP